jgi:hypothetical protein
MQKILLIGLTADISTTIIALNLGLRERNPVIIWFMERVLLLPFMSFEFMVVFLIPLIMKYVPLRVERHLINLFISVGVLRFLAGIWNLGLITIIVYRGSYSSLE